MIDLSKQVSASLVVFHAAYRGQPPSTASKPLEWRIEQVRSLGIGVEIWLSEQRFASYSADDRTALRDLLSGVYPFTAHSDQSRWEPGKLREEIELASFLGASILVVHLGTLALEDPEPPITGITEIAAFARDHGLMLALENSGRTGIAPLRDALDLVGSAPRASGLGICIDTGHANRSQVRDGVPPAAFLQELREVVVEVHVNDNEGAADLHLPPGEGTTDWPSTLAAIRELRDDAVICLEVTSPDDPVQAIRQSVEFVRATQIRNNMK